MNTLKRFSGFLWIALGALAIFLMARQAGAEIAAAAERARRYDQDITPRSIEVAERAELAYRKGALGLTDLLDARRTLRAALIDQLAARADLAKAVVALQLRTRTAP